MIIKLHEVRLHIIQVFILVSKMLVMYNLLAYCMMSVMLLLWNKGDTNNHGIITKVQGGAILVYLQSNKACRHCV